MDENLTSEEKLFKKAQEGKKDPLLGGKQTVNKILNQAKGFLKFLKKDSAEKISSPLKSLESKDRASFVTSVFDQGLDLKSINHVFIVILVGFTLATGYIAIYERPDISGVMSAVLKIRFQENESEPISNLQVGSFYLTQIRKRNVFEKYEELKPVVEVIEVAPPPPPPPPKVPITEKIANVKIIGISFGDNPKAIIQDGKSQELYFLKKGEEIGQTGVFIEEILRKKIIVISEEDKTELEL